MYGRASVENKSLIDAPCREIVNAWLNNAFQGDLTPVASAGLPQNPVKNLKANTVDMFCASTMGT